ncbi:ubiquitin carboxyl-terminal hydrolase MINDY-1-like isoform X1 [Artemia franciscana]|uniref:MINDY deubiquitinase domain-containing protein n=1 Tax=Artemia franciscana TaxID=6661 RepID=A0AA88HWQ6_ARTSF|nr:hypothetical protein QYM36_005755 [Artemia franciscana]
MEFPEDQEADISGSLDLNQQGVAEKYAGNQQQEDSATPDHSLTTLPEIDSPSILEMEASDYNQPLDHKAAQPNLQLDLEPLSSHSNMKMTKEGVQLVTTPKSEDESTDATFKINTDTTINESTESNKKPTEINGEGIIFGHAKVDYDQPLDDEASQPHLPSDLEALSSVSDMTMTEKGDVQPAIVAISEDETTSNSTKFKAENTGNEATGSVAKPPVIDNGHSKVGDSNEELPAIVRDINDDKDIIRVGYNKINSKLEQGSVTLRNMNESEGATEKEVTTEKDSEDPTRSEKSIMRNVEVNSSLDTGEPSQEMLNRFTFVFSEKTESKTAVEIQNTSLEPKSDKIKPTKQTPTIPKSAPDGFTEEEESDSSQPIDISNKESLIPEQNWASGSSVREIADKASLLSGVAVGAAASAVAVGAAASAVATLPGNNSGEVDTILDTNALKKADSKNDVHQTEVSTLDEIVVLSASEITSQESSQFHYIKWIMWKGIKTPIVTQNANGPCPLLAIVNVLLLKRQIDFAPGTEIVTSEKLLELIGNFILENVPKNIGDAAENYEQNLSDVLAILPKLQSGIDVNVKFTSVSDFEFTPELALFDLVQIKLFHGWVIDREQLEEVKAVGKRSYNQLVEMIISSKCGDKQDCLNAEIAEAFLEQTATQLTYQGLVDLTFTVQDDELAVFFRNNHFSTIYKTNNQMFTLLTDQGFLKDDSNIWETLQDIDGSGIFVNSSFMIGGKPLSIFPGKEQEGKDFEIAAKLQREAEEIQEASVFSGKESPLTDEQLAHQLQQEEERRVGTSTSDLPSPSTSTGSQRRPSTATRRQSANRDNKSSCTVL